MPDSGSTSTKGLFLRACLQLLKSGLRPEAAYFRKTEGTKKNPTKTKKKMMLHRVFREKKGRENGAKRQEKEKDERNSAKLMGKEKGMTGQ